MIGGEAGTARHLDGARCGKCHVKGGVWIEPDGYSFCVKCQHKESPKVKGPQPQYPMAIVCGGRRCELVNLEDAGRPIEPSEQLSLL